MRRKCKLCNHRRETRGSDLCDECAEDWWLVNGGFEWEDSMKEYGWAATSVPTDAEVSSVVLLVERRWAPIPPGSHYVPSRLWDTTTPTTGVLPQTTGRRAK